MKEMTMIVIYFLAAVLLICTWVTTSLYIVVWYEAVNSKTRADKRQWRKKIPYFAILKGVLMESWCLFLVIITTPLRLYFDRIPIRPVPDSRPPVLFVHGWGCSSHVFFYIFLFLKHYGFKNLYFITYRPIFADVRKLADQVADKIDWVAQTTGAPKINVISHSLGGVLTRYVVKNTAAGRKVDKLITLGSPHMGSRVAAFIPAAKNTVQLMYHSPFLKELAEGGMTPGDTAYVSIYSDFDNFIIPQDSSYLGEKAKNIKVLFHGHTRLLYSRFVIRLIISALEDDEPTVDT